jgi:hypothetical protein
MITPITETTKLMFFKHFDNMLGKNSPSEPLLHEVDKQCFIGYELPLLHVWEVLSEVVNTRFYEFKQQETK